MTSSQAFEYAGLIIEPPKSVVETALSDPYPDEMQMDGNLTPQTQTEYKRGELSRQPSLEDRPDLILESFSEMVTEYPIDRKVPLIVLDCANIGWNYGNTSFSAYGLQLALSLLKQYHVEIKAFIPSSYVQKRLVYQSNSGNQPQRTNAMMQTEELDILQGLIHKKIIAVVPPGDSDDTYIINYARNHSGFIISNDYFQDHIKSLSDPSMRLSMRLWITENRVSYTFVGKDNFFINPNSSLSMRLERCQRTGGPGGSVRGEESTSPRSTAKQHVQQSLQYLSKAINEFNKIHRYDEMKQLILMKAKLYYEMQLFQESFEEIQNILLFVDENCLEAKQILKLIQERATQVLGNQPPPDAHHPPQRSPTAANSMNVSHMMSSPPSQPVMKSRQDAEAMQMKQQMMQRQGGHEAMRFSSYDQNAPVPTRQQPSFNPTQHHSQQPPVSQHPHYAPSSNQHHHSHSSPPNNSSNTQTHQQQQLHQYSTYSSNPNSTYNNQSPLPSPTNPNQRQQTGNNPPFPPSHGHYSR